MTILLAWMREHFAYETLVAGVESEVDKDRANPPPNLKPLSPPPPDTPTHTTLVNPD